MKVEEQAPTTAARAAVLTATVGLPAVSCAPLRQVSGMDRGVATELDRCPSSSQPGYR